MSGPHVKTVQHLLFTRWYQLSYSFLISRGKIIILMAVGRNWMQSNTEGAVFETNIFCHVPVKSFFWQTHDLTLICAVQTSTSDMLWKTTNQKTDWLVQHQTQSMGIMHADFKSVGGWMQYLSSQSGPCMSSTVVGQTFRIYNINQFLHIHCRPNRKLDSHPNIWEKISWNA